MRLDLAVLTLALVLLAPGAVAFRAPSEPVSLAFDADRAPLVTAAGALALEGRASGALVALGAENLSFGPVPEVVLARRSADGSFANETIPRARVILHQGGLYWSFLDGATAQASLAAVFGLLVTLPGNRTTESESEAAGSARAFLLAAPRTTGTVAWAAGSGDLFPMNATVSVLDARGNPVRGLDRARVNEGATPGNATSGGGEGLVLRLTGRFDVAWTSDVLLTSAGADANVAVGVARSGAPDFATLAHTLAAAGPALSGAGDGVEDPFSGLSPVARMLNGAVLLFSPPDDTGARPAAIDARVGGDTVETGLISYLRAGDLAVAWRGDEMRVEGESALAFTANGFAVAAPPAIGPVPVVSLLLWLVAAAALAFFVVKRPPKDKAPLPLRLAAAATHVVVFLGVFVLWDRSFASTFGVSFLTMLGEDGPWQVLLGVLAVQMLPWGLAALLFALPVRIAVGVAVRHFARKKGMKGFAEAAGLVFLAALGPLHALWIMNAVLVAALERVPALGG